MFEKSFNFSQNVLELPALSGIEPVIVHGAFEAGLYFLIVACQSLMLLTAIKRWNLNEAGSYDMCNSLFVQVSHLILGLFQGVPVWILMFSSSHQWTTTLCDFSALAIFITFAINIWAIILLSASRYYHIVCWQTLSLKNAILSTFLFVALSSKFSPYVRKVFVVV